MKKLIIIFVLIPTIAVAQLTDSEPSDLSNFTLTTPVPSKEYQAALDRVIKMQHNEDYRKAVCDMAVLIGMANSSDIAKNDDVSIYNGKETANFNCNQQEK